MYQFDISAGSKADLYRDLLSALDAAPGGVRDAGPARGEPDAPTAEQPARLDAFADRRIGRRSWSHDRTVRRLSSGVVQGCTASGGLARRRTAPEEHVVPAGEALAGLGLVGLVALLLTLTDRTRTGLATRHRQLLAEREAGLSTLEITVIALGLFVIAGIAVAVLTGATQSRLDQIQ